MCRSLSIASVTQTYDMEIPYEKKIMLYQIWFDILFMSDHASGIRSHTGICRYKAEL